MRIAQACLLPVSAFLIYACSSSDSETTPTVDGGASSTSTSTSSGGDAAASSSSGDAAVGVVNPIMGATPTVYFADAVGPFIDGLVWKDNTIYFTIPGSNLILRRTGADTADQVRTMSGGVIGLALNKAGTAFLGAASPSGAAGTVVTIIPTSFLTAPMPFSGQATRPGLAPRPFDSPNDIAVRPTTGDVFVSDPGYQIANGGTLVQNRLLSIPAAGGNATEVKTYTENEKPNGIAFTKDGNTLYVSYTTSAPVKIVKFTLTGNTLGAETLFVSYTGAANAINLDGLAVDNDGNVYAATKGGVDVYKSNAMKWGTLAIPEATNIAFGGADGKTLYVATGNGKIFSVPVAVAGPT